MRFRSIRYPSALARGGKGPILNTLSPLEADCATVRRSSLSADAREMMRDATERAEQRRRYPSLFGQSGRADLAVLVLAMVLGVGVVVALPILGAMSIERAQRADACYTLGETLDNESEFAAFEIVCGEDYPNV